MKKKIGMVLTILIFSSSVVFAHPGRTDSSGCHTCRTNCAKYGLSNGEYHCHDGSSSSSSSKKTTSSSSSNSSSTSKKTTTVKKSSDKSLKTLKIDGKTIDLDDELEYITEEESIIILATATDKNAKLNYDKEVKLNVGENKIKIKVIAEDGSTKTYTITVIREEEVIPVISEGVTKAEETEKVYPTQEDDSALGGLIVTAGIGGLGYLGYKKYKENKK